MEVHLEIHRTAYGLVLLSIFASHALHKTRDPLGSGKTAEARTICQQLNMPCCHGLS